MSTIALLPNFMLVYIGPGWALYIIAKFGVLKFVINMARSRGASVLKSYVIGRYILPNLYLYTPLR